MPFIVDIRMNILNKREETANKFSEKRSEKRKRRKQKTRWLNNDKLLVGHESSPETV